MKHRVNKTRFGRGANHHTALLRNLISSLLKDGSLTTTAAKGRLLASRAEVLLTVGKQPLSLHTRRRLLRELKDSQELARVTEAAQAAGARTGGRVRLTRLKPRRGDNAPMVKVEFVRYD